MEISRHRSRTGWLLLRLLAVADGCRSQNSRTIAVIPGTTATELWEAAHGGAAAAGRKTGFRIYWNAPTRCEVWGAQGAYGGEGYGWGAVLPAHIIRNLIGFRDPRQPDELPLALNLPEAFMVGGRTYRAVNLQYRGAFWSWRFMCSMRSEFAWRAYGRGSSGASP